MNFVSNSNVYDEDIRYESLPKDYGLKNQAELKEYLSSDFDVTEFNYAMDDIIFNTKQILNNKEPVHDYASVKMTEKGHRTRYKAEEEKLRNSRDAGFHVGGGNDLDFSVRKYDERIFLRSLYESKDGKKYLKRYERTLNLSEEEFQNMLKKKRLPISLYKYDMILFQRARFVMAEMFITAFAHNRHSFDIPKQDESPLKLLKGKDGTIFVQIMNNQGKFVDDVKFVIDKKDLTDKRYEKIQKDFYCFFVSKNNDDNYKDSLAFKPRYYPEFIKKYKKYDKCDTSNSIAKPLLNNGGKRRKSSKKRSKKSSKKRSKKSSKKRSTKKSKKRSTKRR